MEFRQQQYIMGKRSSIHPIPLIIPQFDNPNLRELQGTMILLLKAKELNLFF